VVDEQILDQAKRESGLKTYSEVVNLALREYVRRLTFARIDDFTGSGIWEGDLAVMREDSVVHR